MARADLPIDIVRAGAQANQELFRRSLEALITEERSNQHYVLADRLAAHLQLNGHPNASVVVPGNPNGASSFLRAAAPSGVLPL
jgi:hypothetical protein